MSDDSEDKPNFALREAEDLAELENTPFPHRFMCHCFKCQRPFIDCSGCKAASRYKQLRKDPEAFAAEALALPPPEYACYQPVISAQCITLMMITLAKPMSSLTV